MLAATLVECDRLSQLIIARIRPAVCDHGRLAAVCCFEVAQQGRFRRSQRCACLSWGRRSTVDTPTLRFSQGARQRNAALRRECLSPWLCLLEGSWSDRERPRFCVPLRFPQRMLRRHLFTDIAVILRTSALPKSNRYARRHGVRRSAAIRRAPQLDLLPPKSANEEGILRCRQPKPGACATTRPVTARDTRPLQCTFPFWRSRRKAF